MANKTHGTDDTLEPATLSIADLIAALKASSGNDDESMRRRAQFEAEAHQRLQKKENVDHPGISVYSYPEGDVARPKPPLHCKMFWVGYDLQADQLTPDEIDLLNLATPGDYTFTKTDGSIEKLEIIGTNGHNGKIERLEFQFPCRGDNKHNLPGMAALLRQVFGTGTPDEALLAELARLRAQLATAHA
jgi:hypothetical protein